MNTDELLATKTRRDRWGRYVVLPVGGTKPVGYTRATTIAKTLDDQNALIEWKARMVVLGVGARPDLAARAAVIDKDDRKALQKLAEDAAEAGGSTIRRDQGTAIHAALEAGWHDLAAVPAMFATEAKAVHDALKAAGLSVVENMAERMVVNDAYAIAGTFDLVLTDGVENYVADVKTGSSLLGALGFAIQLYIYASADNLYRQGAADDGSQDVRDTMPALSRERGVVIHVEPGATTCDLHWLDLNVGREALDLALQVREMRKAKPLTKIEAKPADREAAAVEKITTAFPGTELLVTDAWRAWMRERIEAIVARGAKRDLALAWPAGVPTLKSADEITVSQAAEIESACQYVEAKHQMPFLDFPNPMAKDTLPALDVWTSNIKPAPLLDEGRDVTLDEVAHIKKLSAALPPEAKAWVQATIAGARKAGRPIRLTGNGGELTERRMVIAEALCRIAELGEDIVAALLREVTGSPVDSVAVAIGSLSIGQATLLSGLAASIDQGFTTIAYELDGSVSLHGELAA